MNYKHEKLTDEIKVVDNLKISKAALEAELQTMKRDLEEGTRRKELCCRLCSYVTEGALEMQHHNIENHQLEKQTQVNETNIFTKPRFAVYPCFYCEIVITSPSHLEYHRDESHETILKKFGEEEFKVKKKNVKEIFYSDVISAH